MPGHMLALHEACPRNPPISGHSPLMFALCSSDGCRQRICPGTARCHPRQSAARADGLLSGRRLPCPPVQRRAYLCRGGACDLLRTGQHGGAGVASDAVLRRLWRARRGGLVGDGTDPQRTRQAATCAALGARGTGIALRNKPTVEQPVVRSGPVMVSTIGFLETKVGERRQGDGKP
jgi:hypothetical protein